MNAPKQNQSTSPDPRQDPAVAEIVQRAKAWLDARRASTSVEGRTAATPPPNLEGRAPASPLTNLSPPPPPANSGEPGEPNVDPQRLPGEPEASPTRSDAEPNPFASEPGSSTADQNSPAREPRWGEAPAEPAQLTVIQRHMIAALKERASSQSPLDRLPPERQQLILELLEDYPAEAVANAISLPEPLGGWGIETSRPSINRFRKRVEETKRRQARAGAARAAEDFLRQNANNPDAFLRAADQQLKLRLYEISQDSEASPETLGALCKIVAEIRKLDLAERKLTHQQ